MTTIAMATADVRDLSLLRSYSGVTISSVQARTGTYSYTLSGGAQQLNLALNNGTIYFRVALYIPIAATVTLYFVDAGDNANTKIVFSAITGTVNAYRSTTLLGASAGDVVLADTWQVFEGKTVIHDSSGEVVVKRNGIEVLNLTGVDTKASVYTVVTTFRIMGGGSGTSYVDDIILDDSAYPGLGGIQVLVPTGNGTYTAWTNDYTAVDDNPPNDDSDYISTDADTTGTKENFTFDDLASGAANITRIGVLSKARLDDVGSGNLKNTVRSGGSDYEGSSVGLSTSYSWVESYWDTDPADAGAWTKSKVDSLEIGVISA